MARLLYITNGLSGGLNASYELARRLGASGHEVEFLGYGDLASRVEGQGYRYTRVSAADRAMEELRERVDRAGLARSFAAGASLRRQVIASDEVATTVKALKPDALVIDLEAHYSILATRSLGIPTVLKNDFFSLVWERGVPPLHSELPYPDSARLKLQADGEWVRAQVGRYAQLSVGELRPQKLMRRWTPFRYNTVSRRDLKAVARSRNLRLADLTSRRHWLHPHVYPDVPMMSATARELDFVTKTSPNDEWIGPLVFRDRNDVALSAEDRTRWERFRDRNEEQGRPLLYCAFGTMLPDTSAMLSRVVGAVRSRPNYDLVVGLGGRNELLALNDDNILALDYAPQLEVLDRADAALVHGGINTINECLTFGVPMILERTGPTDGPGNASRVEHHGVGRRVRFGEIAVPSLAAMIDQVVGDKALHRRVREMQGYFQRYEDDQVAEQLVERLLKAGPIR